MSLSSALGLIPAAKASTLSWSLTSPDYRCSIAVTIARDSSLTYETRYNGRLVIHPSRLGLRSDQCPLSHGFALARLSKPVARREVYDLYCGPQAHVDHRLNFRTLAFTNETGAALEIELAASDQGVAFRYRIPGTNPAPLAIEEELTEFHLPRNARGWLQPYHAASAYTPAYEDFYFQVAPGERPPRSRAEALGWSFPALFETPDAKAWVLLTESDTGPSYAACHLAAESPDGVYSIELPALNEADRKNTNQMPARPRWHLPWEMPWRVITMGASPASIAQATLVTDLAPESRILDPSWIRPGRASWAWWSHPDGPVSAELFNRFTDFAASMNWEYTLFDAGWWKVGLPALTGYATSRGISALAWCSASEFYEDARRKRKLDELQSAGVAGIKVDFWCSDKQEAISAMHSLLDEAASRRLVVIFHGCTVPRGWQRTWPNLLTVEAVLGAESYFYEPRYGELAAELNTILPFTRNAVGPMDYTPVAGSIRKYPRTTTAAHELATSIVFSSGLIHFADDPSFFGGLPSAAQQLLRDAPARWDESLCLVGDPGHSVVFARRSGTTWFIAGLSARTEAQLLTLDLRPYRKFNRRVLLTDDLNEPRFKVATTTDVSSQPLKLMIPPRGGFILKMAK